MIAKKSWDVLQKRELRSYLTKDTDRFGPEVPLIVRAAPFSHDRERLARISRSDDVHRVAPWSAIEGSNVVPDNSLIQGRVFHPRHESGCGEGFPFDMAHSSICRDGDGEPEVDAACA